MHDYLSHCMNLYLDATLQGRAFLPLALPIDIGLSVIQENNMTKLWIIKAKVVSRCQVYVVWQYHSCVRVLGGFRMAVSWFCHGIWCE